MKNSPLFLKLLVTSILIGIVGWYVVGALHPMLPMDPELAMVVQPTQEQLDQKISHNRWNDSYALAMFAGLLLFSGTPLLLKCSKSVVVGGMLAALAVVVGTPLGIGAAWLGFLMEDWMPIGLDVLVRVALRWGAVLIPTGILAGVLIWIADRNAGLAKMVTGGIVGAVMAALAYCLLAAVFLKTENTDSMVPASSAGRMLLFVTSPFVLWGFIAYQIVSDRQTEPAVAKDVEQQAA